MKKFLIAAMIAASCTGALAGPDPGFFNDLWTGPDKTKHLVAGALVGSTVTLATKNEWYGFGVGCGVGAAKEIYDRRQVGHRASFQDFAVTCLGAGLAAGGAKFFVNKEAGTTQIIYSHKF